MPFQGSVDSNSTTTTDVHRYRFSIFIEYLLIVLVYIIPSRTLTYCGCFIHRWHHDSHRSDSGGATSNEFDSWKNSWGRSDGDMRYMYVCICVCVCKSIMIAFLPFRGAL